MSTISKNANVSRLFVVLNPKSGSFAENAVKNALGSMFSCEDGSCVIHEMTGQDDLAKLAREASERGCGIVVAAGGDGTVSAIAEGLVGSDTPLGIIPLGTANVLARELGIPVELNAAVALLAGPYETKAIDAMNVKEKHYFTQVGVGIDSLMIAGTTRERKQRFGRIAYITTAVACLAGFEPRRFTVTVDKRKTHRRASQVLLANCGTLGQPPFRWGPDITPDDGRIDVCIARARTFVDYLQLGWLVVRGRQSDSPNVHYLAAERSVSIKTHTPLPVQADGEIIGQTPVSVRVVQGAIRVVVPVKSAKSSQKPA
jgi:YegS/Rv2252/BmrU family lipid kinase